MLDEKTETMLKIASSLTTGDLEMLRGAASVATDAPSDSQVIPARAPAASEPWDGREAVTPTVVATPTEESTMMRRTKASLPSTAPASSRGEYERQRTRESKVSTTCMGKEREKHEWWPLGTDVVGRIGAELFRATVVENAQVKSGRSLLITSGTAAGKICITPTGAAIEATESYRQAQGLGRGGGVTNGWEFWRAVNR